MKPGIFIALLMGMGLLMSGILMHPAGLSLAALAAFVAGVALLITSKLLKRPQPLDTTGKGSSWRENLSVAAVGTLLFSLAAFLVVGVSYWFWGVATWVDKHYETYKPAGQPVAELAHWEQIAGAPGPLSLSVSKGDIVSYYWDIDCSASKLTPDCNDWPTYFDLGCDMRYVGNRSGSFVAWCDSNVVFATKAPFLASIRNPNGGVHGMGGKIWWDAHSK